MNAEQSRWTDAGILATILIATAALELLELAEAGLRKVGLAP